MGDSDFQPPGARALRRCYFVGGGVPVDLGRRRRRAPARRPRLIGGGVAGKHRRRGRLVINYWKLATTNNKQCTIRLSCIVELLSKENKQQTKAITTVRSISD